MDAAFDRSPSGAGTGNEGTADIRSIIDEAEEVRRPCYITREEKSKFGPAGLYYHGRKASKRQDEPPIDIDLWICGPLYVEAVTRDRDGHNFGRVLRFRDSLGGWHWWGMPMEMLKGSCEDMRGELLRGGLEINPGNRTHLPLYLQHEKPPNQMLSALSVGWHGAAFVLPDEVIGGGDVFFQTEWTTQKEFIQAGTLADWQDSIGMLCVGNPLLLFSVAVAFAGPLLRLVDRDGGGFHLFGDSSTGKSTSLKAACSVWGGEQFRRTWRATANGMEATACLFNDCLLALDEISECDPREVGAISYSIANGTGKQRANRTGAARTPQRWRVMLLSNGERTLAGHMGEAGKEPKAGQEVRLLDIPVSRAHGLFDDLHGRQNGAMLANDISTAAAKYYGTPGREFLAKLIDDVSRKRDFSKFAADTGTAFDIEGQASGQEMRALQRFALVAMAGELAIEYGVVPWPFGAAIDAASVCFELWREHRGGGNTEPREIRRRVSHFIERHGDSRFSDITGERQTQGLDGDAQRPVYNRAGYWKDTAAGRVYLFNSPGLQEALGGFDLRRGLEILTEAGWLSLEGVEHGKRSRKYRTLAGGVRLYQIVPGTDER
jgi:putative DNA primase/helicase